MTSALSDNLAKTDREIDDLLKGMRIEHKRAFEEGFQWNQEQREQFWAGMNASAERLGRLYEKKWEIQRAIHASKTP